MLQPAAGGAFTLGFAIDASAVRTAGGAIAPGPRMVWHNGANRGFRAVLAAAPDRGDAFVVLTNSDRGLAMTDDLFCEWGLLADRPRERDLLGGAQAPRHPGRGGGAGRARHC